MDVASLACILPMFSPNPPVRGGWGFNQTGNQIPGRQKPTY